MCIGATSAHAKPFRLVVTTKEIPLVPNSILNLAEREGYFDRAGVDVEIISVGQTPMAVAALRSGDVDMANISLDSILSLHREGANNIVAVHSSDKSIPYVIVSRPDLELGSLSGVKFGIGRMNSLDQQLSDRVLSDLGVNTKSLALVPLGDPGVRSQGLISGRIDATTMSIGAFLSIPNHQQFKILVDQETFFKQAPLVTKVNAISRQTLASRGDDLQRVLEALTLAARDYAADPSQWVNAMRNARPEVDPDTLNTLAQQYRGSWTVNGGLQRQELQYSADRTQWSPKRIDGVDTTFHTTLDEWVDFGPMDKVLERLSSSKLGDPVNR